MLKKISGEIILWLFLLIPYIYLYQIWDQLPDIVPTHFNFSGEADGWSSKRSLLFLPAFLGIGIYLLLLFLPELDPKKNISLKDPKYYGIRFIMACFFSMLSTYILYTALVGKISNTTLLFGFIGVLFAVIGNYFKDIKPNYFIGIRTPWTLEDERVWEHTHQIGSKIWMFGGLGLFLSAIFISDEKIFLAIFFILLILMIFLPIIYSYLDYKNGKPQ
jgi:uncharacterized membrane protein